MPTIPYIKGLEVKPFAISEIGVVSFTDDTNNDIQPNEIQCQAYGYTYDKQTGTCFAFKTANHLNRNIQNINNNTQGANNSIELGTNNTYIMGESNTVKGLSRNNIIIGSNNEIKNGVNNASIFGNYGIAQRDGEVVIGGGGFSGTGKGYAQSSTITLTGTTTDGTATSLFVNGDSSTTIIARESGVSAQGFEANVIGIRTGGTAAGNTYDRIFLRATGLVFLKNVSETVATLGSFGTVTGWTSEVDFAGTNDMFFKVKGASNMDISWSCTLNIYEIKL